MDTPLLALTRRTAGGLPGRPPKEAAAENMRQLIQLRWLAVGGQLIAILVARFGLGVPLPLDPMLTVVGLLALANLLFTVTLRRLWIVNGELLIALLLDMAALTALLYLSGGARNPFVSLYLLQVVLGAILLPPLLAGLLLAAASLCFAFLSLSHLALTLPAGWWGSAADLRLAGEGISFVMVASLLLLFIARISRNLRSRDAYVAELKQRTAEEDGIVRMGLFASGAAHELGTPLSSLSVLLTDWRRHPAIAADAELSQELIEAQGELGRCKEIVSNILHSAGQARGEAMGSTDVPQLLEEIVASWREVHPSVPLSFDAAGIGGVRVAAEPALRQAIWNLLENASDASAEEVSLRVHAGKAWLTIAVLDRGPGFRRDQVERIGQLYQSSKGAGHGLGLFLASNVARRLGGTLEALNREDGGAEVRLRLPLASANAG